MDKETIKEKDSCIDEELNDYLEQLKQQKLLTLEDEIRLGKIIQTGIISKTQLEKTNISLSPEDHSLLQVKVDEGLVARDEMFQANQGLVASIAKKYVHRGLPYEDLFQEGSLGLLDAIDKYNPESGNRFSTYATNWIRQKIIRSIENGGRTVRIPSRVVQNINHLSDIKYQLLQKLHRDPTLEELANEMNLSVEKIIELENYSKKNVSLDNTVGDDEDASIMDLIPDTNTQDALQVAEKQIKLQEILDELNQLPQRNKEIVEKYFGLNGRKEESLVEIGRDYGFTKERARQIKDDSLREIRKKIDQNI